MRTLAIFAVAAAALSTAPLQAKGCVRGAVAGGVAGHMVGKGHGVAGAVAGCAAMHHHYAKKAAAKTK